MQIRRWVLTPLVFALFASSSVSFSPVLAKQKKDQKQEKFQQQELQAAYKIADTLAAGQPVPGDVGMSIRTDFLKAQNGLTFVPFVLSLDPAQSTPRSVTLYVRIVSKNPPAAPAKVPAVVKKPVIPIGEEPEDPQPPPPPPLPTYAFEGVHYIDLKTPASGDPYRLSRAFTVPAGEYDLYLIVKERPPIDAKGKAKSNPKIGFLKQPITVPDLWGSDLTTSSIILAEALKPLEKPPTAQQIEEQPYILGNNLVVPAARTTLPKSGSIDLVFLIYNAGQDGNRKPDVAVEYLFYQRFADKPEAFFNKTNPQAFNATTLPPQFDAAAGHNVLAGQSVGLEKFPLGEYRLEIRITDKLSGKVVTRNITFSVTA